MAETAPDTRSAAQTALMPDWQMIRDVRAGEREMRTVARERGYLPKFEDESDVAYKARVDATPFTAHYEDATRALIAKPFTKEVVLQGSGEQKDQIPPDAKAWAEDIDLEGNNLHVFAMETMEEAVHLGGCFLFVDFPKLSDGERPQTLGQERQLGLRPFVQRIAVDDVLAVHDAVIGGVRRLTSFRWLEIVVEVDESGFGEVSFPRVRHLTDDLNGTVEMTVYEKAGGNGEWGRNASLSGKIDIPFIPIVPFIIGRTEQGRYAARPPMLDVVSKQIEHFRHSGRIAAMFDASAFPMLQGQNMDPPKDADGNVVALPVGPRATLWTGAVQGSDVKPGEFKYLEPRGDSLELALKYLDTIESAIRTMALQPTVPARNLQNVAATHTAVNAARTHAVVQAWALHLKDRLEQMFVLMYAWRGQDSPVEVSVNTDFSEDLVAETDLRELRELYAARAISLRTLWQEWKRRGKLGPQFDEEKEEGRLAEEDGGLGMDFGGGLPSDPANGQVAA